jgi:hypothetical protein
LRRHRRRLARLARRCLQVPCHHRHGHRPGEGQLRLIGRSLCAF